MNGYPTGLSNPSASGRSTSETNSLIHGYHERADGTSLTVAAQGCQCTEWGRYPPTVSSNVQYLSRRFAAHAEFHMWSFWTGQKIVCVNDKWDTSRVDHEKTIRPRLSQIYTIREIFQTAGPETVLCFHLVEINNPVLNYQGGRFELRFRSAHFRPVKDTKSDISIFTQIKDNPKFKIQDPIRIKEPA